MIEPCDPLWFEEPVQWENGYIIPPTRPGLGIELNEEITAKHPYKEASFQVG